MKRAVCKLALVFFMGFTLAGIGSAARAESPEEFVSSFYQESSLNIGLFDPKQSDRLAAATRDKLLANERARASGDGACFDINPVVAGQDFDVSELKKSLKTTAERSKGTAIVTARFTNFGEPRVVEWTLQQKDETWLVTDLGIPAENFRLSTTVCKQAGDSASARFNAACTSYMAGGNYDEVAPEQAAPHCTCLARKYAEKNLEDDALDFLTRTYSEDFTTFTNDYKDGETWMEASFEAEMLCLSEAAQ
jgi:hypothetical protein